MANEFNPQADLPKEDNFLNYSRGFKNTAVGDAITGAAATLDTGLGAVDRGLAQRAEDETRAAVEDTDAQMLGVQSQPPRQDPLDAEVRTQVRNLESKKLAMDAGTIDPQHYYATVQARVKDIRGRYAGYNDTIDTELKKMGIDPNWQRNQILEEGVRAQRARAGAAAEEAKNNREFAEKFMTDKTIAMDPQMRAEWAADPNWAQNPTNMKRLKLSVGASKAMWGRYDLEKLQADTAEAGNKDGATKTGAAYMRGLDTLFYVGAKNGGVSDILKKQIEVSQRDQEAGTPNPEHQQALLTAYRNWRQQMELGRQSIAAQFSDSPWQWASDKKQVDDLFDSRLAAMDKALNDKDWGALNAIVINNRAKIESGKQNILKNDFMVTLSAGTELGIGTPMLSSALRKNVNLSDPLSQDLLNSYQVDQLKGKVASLDEMFKKGQQEGIKDPKYYQNGFEQSVEWIMGKDYPVKERTNVFQSMFGEKNRAWWDNMMLNPSLSAEDKRAYYRTLTSPQMQAAVKELSQYDRQTATKYYSYVKYMFDKMNADSVSDIQGVVTSSNTEQITYDPDTHHLVLSARPGDDSTIAGSVVDRARGGQDAVDNWNQGIDALIPLWKEQGLDPEKMTQQLMINNGVNLAAPHTGNAVDNYINSLPSNEIGVQEIDENGNYVGPAKLGKGTQPSKLGGPGMEQGTPKVGNPADRPVSGEDQTARRSEALEIVREINKTEDPETKQYLRGLLKSLGPFDNTELKGSINEDTPNQSSVNPPFDPNENMNTKSGEVEPGLGQPDKEAGKVLLSMVPGTTLAEGVKSGDPKTIAIGLTELGLAAMPQEMIAAAFGKIGSKIIYALNKGDVDESVAKMAKGKTKFQVMNSLGDTLQQGREAVQGWIQDRFEKAVAKEAEAFLKTHKGGLDKEGMEELTRIVDKYKVSNKGILTSRKNNIVEDGGNVVQFPGNNRPSTLANQESNVTSLEGRRIANEIDAKGLKTSENNRGLDLKTLIEESEKNGVLSTSADGTRVTFYKPDGTKEIFRGTKQEVEAYKEKVRQSVEDKIAGNSTAGQFSGIDQVVDSISLFKDFNKTIGDPSRLSNRTLLKIKDKLEQGLNKKNLSADEDDILETHLIKIEKEIKKRKLPDLKTIK